MKRGMLLLMFALVIALIFTTGCGKKASDEELINLEPPSTETIQPEEPILDLEPAKEETPAPLPEPEPVAVAEIEPEPVMPVMGFRVQLHAFRDKESADIAQRNAESRLDLPVYNEFIDEWYKVRIGNFITKEEAEIYREKCARKGFPDAWVIECEIEQ